MRWDRGGAAEDSQTMKRIRDEFGLMRFGFLIPFGTPFFARLAGMSEETQTAVDYITGGAMIVLALAWGYRWNRRKRRIHDAKKGS